MSNTKNPLLSSTASETGKTIGHFRVGIEIGRGSFANVYKGVDLKDGNKTVAIKSVFRNRLKNKKLLKNLEIEIEILKNLKNPHIVSLLSCIKTDNHFHLIMDYCSLGDLSFFIRKKSQLSNHHPIIKAILENYPCPEGSDGLNQIIVMNFIKQLASALKFLRSQNLIHRDIKPQNLLLCPPTETKKKFMENNYTGSWDLPILKVADFGFARYLSSTSMAETLCGSPLYMAPEILRYEKYNAKADLWSVGAVIYEMAVGKPPFRASNHIELLKKIEQSNDEINFPSDVEISQDLIRLICGLLKANPIDRMGFNEFFNDPIIMSHNEDVKPISDSLTSSEVYVSEYLTDKDFTKEESKENRKIENENKNENKNENENNQPKNKNTNQISTKLTLEKINENDKLGNSKKIIDQFKNSSATPNLKSSISKINVMQDTVESKLNRPYAEKHLHNVLQEQTHNADFKNDCGIEQNLAIKKKIGGDLIVEKDYVVVEKRNVEVNSFADEIKKVSKPLNIDTAEKQRMAAKQRRYSMSVRPNAALKEVIDYTTEKLFGAIENNSVKNAINDQFQTEETTNNKNIDSRETGDNIDINKLIISNVGIMANREIANKDLSKDNVEILHTIELLAMMAHAISLYAEVKFNQVIPLPPSSNTSYQRIHLDKYEFSDGIFNEKYDTFNRTMETNSNTFQYNLAYRNLCREGLVLYLKTLSLLSESINVSAKWWSNNKFQSDINLKMVELIQWVRNRFNESLEKAEYLKLRINRIEEVLDDKKEDSIVYEKLVFDRAIEISKDTAIKELSFNYDTYDTDLIGELKKCEISYSLSIWMLESLLHRVEGNNNLEVLEDDDKKIIENFINSIGTRLLILKNKIDKL